MALTPWLSHFKTDFELARRRRGESIAFHALRCEAFDRFLLLGCPSQADEEWCHVDISPIAEANFSLAAAPSRASIASTPRTSDYCHVNTPWGGLTQFKAAIIYPLWWGFQASANYQDMPPVATAADTVITNAQAASSLGRNLAACGTRVPCTATVTADVVLNNTYFQEPRLHQLDLRFTRIIKLPRAGRIEPQLDIFNMTNSNSILVMTTRLGPAWRNATGVLAPRVVRFGVSMNF